MVYVFSPQVKGVVVVHALAAVVGFVEMIVAIVASAYCCCGSCGLPQQSTVVSVPIGCRFCLVVFLPNPDRVREVWINQSLSES